MASKSQSLKPMCTDPVPLLNFHNSSMVVE